MLCLTDTPTSPSLVPELIYAIRLLHTLPASLRRVRNPTIAIIVTRRRIELGSGVAAVLNTTDPVGVKSSPGDQAFQPDVEGQTMGPDLERNQ